MSEQESAHSPIIRDRNSLSDFTVLESTHARTNEIITEVSKYIVGQEHAITAVARALVKAEAGFNDPGRPIGVFLFLGPTGVGKTELARSIAKVFCGGVDRLKTVECGEFQKDYSVDNILGSPPGFVGSKETGRIQHDWLHKKDASKKIKNSVLLFDEFEKAHPAMRDMLLGALENGELTARNGEKGMQPLNLKNTIFIFTSNIGADEMRRILQGKVIGFNRRATSNVDELASAALHSLNESFAPEFLNRIGRDNIIVFRPLEAHEYPQILVRLLERQNMQIADQLGNARYTLGVTPEFVDWIIQQIDKQYGGRDLRNILDSRIYPEIADPIAGKNIKGCVVLDVEEGRLRMYHGQC